MKKTKILLYLLLLFFPTVVFASSSSDSFMPIGVAIGMEAFVSIHMSVFVLIPLSKMFAPEDYKKLFWKLFAIRVGVLLFFDIFITTAIALFDFFAVFIGAFLIVPFTALIMRKKNPSLSNSFISSTVTTSQVSQNLVCPKCGKTVFFMDRVCSSCGTNLAETISDRNMLCPKCGASIKANFKFCGNCGADVTGLTDVVPKKIVTIMDFDPIYRGTEDMVLENFINKELERAQIDIKGKRIPKEILKRKKVMNAIFSVLLFILVSLIFFHCDFKIYLVGIIILIISFILSKKFDFMKYLKKEIKSRPGEKLSNIVMGIQNSLVLDSSRRIFWSGVALAIFVPVILFWNPHVLYEKTEEGYWVRFYTVGITNYKTVEIPSTYKNKPVVGLRGNAFSNMPFLEKAVLPDSILRINGQAFKNDTRLVDIKLPSKLEYLGGGSFYNCKSLKSIEIPDTVTEMGGETFYNAISLESVKLSKQLPEIRGNSFENCSSLKSIEIPDTVTRIGGHAFYGCTSLHTVTISPQSMLEEIGSSAFRQCSSLKEITLPTNTIVNSRAFKESPTRVKKRNVTTVTIDRTKYPNSEDIYLSSSKRTGRINIYYNGTFIETATISYLGTEFVKGLYEYKFRYVSKNADVAFNLSQDNPTREINSSIAFSLPDNYDLSKTNPTIKITAYYN